VKGGAWHNVLIRQTIGRPRNAALRLRKGQVYGKAAWPPILTEDIWAACSALLADPSRRTITTNTRKHLLTNIARCGVCGDGMRSGKHAATGVPVYKCKGPGTCVARNLRSVDLLVTGYVLDLLERRSVRKLFEPRVSTGRDYSSAMAGLRERKKDAAKLYARGGIDGATLEEINRDIDVQLDQLAASAADAQPLPVLEGVGDVADRWESLSLDRKRVIISRLVTVQVMPSRKGRGFYPESVLIERR
jgi:site-specific DNA recombinase